jgi:ABC-type Na+ efflux pump permease subunit
MREKIRKIIKEHIARIFENEEYYPTFDFEDVPDMQGSAKQAFLSDYEKEFGEEFKEPSESEIKDIVDALYRANLDLPEDYEDLALAQRAIEKQLAGIKTPQEIERMKNIMDDLWGKGAINEKRKLKSEKPPKEPKTPKSTSQKKKKEHKIKPPKPPKHEN